MILSLSDWYASMPLFERVYWYIAFPFTIVFIFQVILTLIGGDVDDLDTDSDIDGGVGFQFLTLKNFIAFLTVFSWTGIAGIHSNLGNFLTVVLSVVSGLIMMFIMAYIVYSMSKLTEDGTWKIRNAIYKTGIVYLTIPAKMEGVGKIQIDVQGLKTLDAITNDSAELITGTIVTVVDVNDSDILIVSDSK
ncbi:MAG: hypothetical protein ABFR62_05195 [Bacteroidota bacterium]